MISEDVLMRIEMLAKYKKACEENGLDLKELLLFQISEELQMIRILKENEDEEDKY